MRLKNMFIFVRFFPPTIDTYVFTFEIWKFKDLNEHASSWAPVHVGVRNGHLWTDIEGPYTRSKLRYKVILYVNNVKIIIGILKSRGDTICETHEIDLCEMARPCEYLLHRYSHSYELGLELDGE